MTACGTRSGSTSTANDNRSATHDGSTALNDGYTAADDGSRLQLFGTFGNLRLFRRFYYSTHMSGKLHAIGSLVERTVEGGQEEHEHFGSHSEEQEEVCSRQVSQFEQGT